MQKKILIPVGIILFAVSLFLIFKPKQEKFILLEEVKDGSVVEGTIFGKNLRLEVANSNRSITTGLGGRETLETDGIIFVFNPPREVQFWMEQVKMPIDLYWIRDRKIIGVEKNLSPPNSRTQEELEIYYSPGVIDRVLEIPVEKGITLEF